MLSSLLPADLNFCVKRCLTRVQALHLFTEARGSKLSLWFGKAIEKGERHE